MTDPVTPLTRSGTPTEAPGRPAEPAVAVPPASAPTAGAAASRRTVREATPLALAGFAANAANVLVTLAVARILSTDDYGTQAQLVAIFFVVSMPGSALLVGIVRRATRWRSTGQTHRIPAWSRRIRRYGIGTILAVAVLGTLLRGPVSSELSVDDPVGLVTVLVAGATWGLLCIDRGLLQSRHAYRGLAVNLLVEGGLRSVLTVGLVVAGLGSTGVALGLLLGVAAADAHARWHLSRHLEPGPVASAAAGSSVPGPA